MADYDRISSLDAGYTSGMLSLFPEALDDREVLNEATNNAVVLLKQTLTYSGKIIIVESTEGFPETGQLTIGPPPGVQGPYELIAYGKKTATTFQNLKRGFSGSYQSTWIARTAYVSNGVSADHHNAVKDAVLNIEKDLGVKEFPEATSLNGILKAQEVRFLAPKPLFRAYPIRGVPPLKVRFQNFSTGHIIRYLWDFGDGGVSLEKSPIHTYVQEGIYTVKLNIVTSTGAQGITTKTEYITVDLEEGIPFFYVDSITDPYSVQTASARTAGTLAPDFTPIETEPKTFRFIDQSDGDIVQRNWVFGDGETESQIDPDIHETTHIYSKPGSYTVTLLIVFANGRLKRVELPEPLTVL